MCRTAADVIQAYVAIDDLLRSEAEGEASETSCSCLREYVQDGDLRGSLYGLVGQAGEPPELGDLLVFDHQVLIGVGVSPAKARRLERALNDRVLLLAGEVPDAQWRTWAESDIETTMAVVAELADRVCAAAERLNDGSGPGPVERGRTKAFIRFGVEVITGLGLIALSATPEAVVGITVLRAVAGLLLDLS
jgi:hypothetical protein